MVNPVSGVTGRSEGERMALRPQNQPNLKVVGFLTAALALIAQPFAVLPFAEVFAATENITQLKFTNDARTVELGEVAHLSVQTQNDQGAGENTSTQGTKLLLSSTSSTGEFSDNCNNLNSWKDVSSLTLRKNSQNRNFCYRDAESAGEHTITVTAVDKDGVPYSWVPAVQVVTVGGAQPELSQEVGVTRYAVVNSFYQGVSAEFWYSGIQDATGCTVTLHREDGSSASRFCTDVTVNLINSKNGARSTISTPFQLTGPLVDEHWADDGSTWGQNTKPTGMTVTITTAHGDVTANSSSSLVEEAATYASIAPADPEPFKINTPRYNVADGKVFAGGPETEVKLVWYPPTNSTNNRYEVRWAKSLEELATTDPVNTGQYPYKVIKDIENGQWFWQMRATKNGEYSDWATPRSFTVDIELEVVNSNPHTTIDAPTGVVGSKFTVSGLATDDEALNRVYVQLVHRGTSQRHGGTSINLIGKGVEAEWSHEFDAKALDLPDGQYAAHAQAVDMKGNRYDTGWTADFTVDTTRPSIELISPTAADYNPSEMSASATDAVGLSVVTLNLYDAANSSLIKNCSRSASGATSFVATCPVPADLTDGTYTIRYNARDLAGNLSQTKTHQFVVDNTTPTITVKDDYVGDKEAKIFSKISFKLFDANMADKYSLNGTVRDFTNNRWSDANYDNIKGLLVQGENELVLYDVAGNSTNYVFTYDSVAPTGTFTYSNNNGNALTRDDVTVTLNTSEAVATPEGWHKQSDKVFTRVFDSNGKYDVTIVDLAGNQTKLNLEVKRIDRNAPTISGVSDGAVVNGPVTLTIHDPKYQGFDGFDANHGLTVNGQKVATQVTADKNYLYVISGEGAYEVVATDKAGNSTSLSFVIDQTAPVVSLEAVEKVDGSRDIVASIADANLSHYWFTVTRDGVSLNLSNTKKYMYTDAFSDRVLATLSQPGEYVVKLEARDKAGNKAGTPTVDGDSVKTISFAITAPSADTATLRRVLGAQINTSSGAILNPAVGTLFGGDVIAQASESDDQSDTAQVLGDQDEQPALSSDGAATTGDDADKDGCWSLLGLCWYWWVLIVAAVITLAVLIRRAAATNEAEAPGRRL